MAERSRIREEKATVSKMIRLYCQKKHSGKELCESCSQIHEYAMQRLEKCRFGENKPVCGKCPVHCYKPDMRKEIRKIMRVAGPWMIVYHPWDAFLHTYRKMTMVKSPLSF
jgi:hypothetical protein